MRSGAGDRQAESELCARMLPAVRAFARRRLVGVDSVNEFTQDVLLLLVEALRGGSVREPEAFGGYTLGICRNVALDRARKRKRRQELWTQYGADLLPLELPEHGQAPLPVALLEDCLSQLSKRAREVIRLSYVEARSHNEVAAALELSLANARVLRHRALGSLRQCMSGGLSWEAS